MPVVLNGLPLFSGIPVPRTPVLYHWTVVSVHMWLKEYCRLLLYTETCLRWSLIWAATSLKQLVSLTPNITKVLKSTSVEQPPLSLYIKGQLELAQKVAVLDRFHCNRSGHAHTDRRTNGRTDQACIQLNVVFVECCFSRNHVHHHNARNGPDPVLVGVATEWCVHRVSTCTCFTTPYITGMC